MYKGTYTWGTAALAPSLFDDQHVERRTREPKRFGARSSGEQAFVLRTSVS